MSIIVEGRPIGNLLYTRELDDSKEKTRGEIMTPDPDPKKALGVLTNGVPAKPQPKRDNPNDESQSS